MKIKVNAEGKRIVLYIPNRVIFSKTGIQMIQKNGDYDFFTQLDPDIMPKIRKEIAKVKRIHKSFTLVSVEQGDTLLVEIKI